MKLSLVFWGLFVVLFLGMFVWSWSKQRRIRKVRGEYAVGDRTPSHTLSRGIEDREVVSVMGTAIGMDSLFASRSRVLEDEAAGLGFEPVDTTEVLRLLSNATQPGAATLNAVGLPPWLQKRLVGAVERLEHSMFRHCSRGTVRGKEVWVFEAPVTTGSGDGERTSWTIDVVTEVPLRGSILEIRPRDVPHDDSSGRLQHFESADFESLYEVFCDDQVFAFSVLDEAMIEYLLGVARPWGFRLEGGLVMERAFHVEKGELGPLVDAALGFVEHIPSVAIEQYPLASASHGGTPGVEPAR